jgi:hypothetical protein
LKFLLLFPPPSFFPFPIFSPICFLLFQIFLLPILLFLFPLTSLTSPFSLSS